MGVDRYCFHCYSSYLENGLPTLADDALYEAFGPSLRSKRPKDPRVWLCQRCAAIASYRELQRRGMPEERIEELVTAAIEEKARWA